MKVKLLKKVRRKYKIKNIFISIHKGNSKRYSSNHPCYDLYKIECKYSVLGIQKIKYFRNYEEYIKWLLKRLYKKYYRYSSKYWL